MDASKINWMRRQCFWEKFFNEYAHNNKYLNREVAFYISFKELRERIKQPPIFTPIEEDFPGPVERWYGEIENNLFILTYYYHDEHSDLTTVSLEDDDDVECIVMKQLNILKQFDIYDNISR